MKPSPTGIKDFSNGKIKPYTLSYGERYYLLCGKVQRLKRAIRRLSDTFSFWKWAVLEAQAEKDSLKELQEQLREGL
jgi:hypothetical protein